MSMSSKSRNDEPPSFITRFIPGLSSQRLEIPSAFSPYLRGQTSFFIRDRRRGNVWEVDIGREGGSFFFEKGWLQFVEDHHIDEGDSLVFKLRDTIFFDFKHYGGNACVKKRRSSFKFAIKEKDLIIVLDEEEESEDYNEEEEEEEEEVAMNNGNCTELVVHENNVNEEEEAEEEEEEEVAVNNGNCAESEDDEYNVEEEEEEEEVSVNKGKKKRKYTPRLTNVAMRKIKDEIFSTGVPKPKNPYFVLKIRPQRRPDLHVPLHVVRYHGLRLPSEMMVVNEEGKGYKAKVSVFKSGVIHLNGWRTFCEWNELELDDKCVLEFVGDKELSLHVRIFRA